MNKNINSLNKAQSENSSSINGSKFALTTKDNPYNPFTQFTDWLLFDNEKGYGTCSYLARIARTSDSLSDSENDYEIERAIDEIVKYNPDLYIKVANSIQ